VKAIFFKELRENLKWAVGIFLIFGAIIYLQIRVPNPNFLFVVARPLGPILLTVVIFGALLGLAQSVFEIRSDNWAFAVHRPVPRLAVFLGKAAAGLLLLYAALVIPLALAVAWVATPGHQPMPFQWRMVLPVAADVLVAAPFYFAGMIVTLRKARWFGSRLLPVGLAIGVVIAVMSAPEFWQAAILGLCGTVIAALAAWNVFSTAGACDAPGGAPRPALGMTIFAGALGIGSFLVAFMGIFQTAAVWHDQRVDRDGNLLQVTWTIENDERSCVVTDAQGHPLPEYEGIDIDDRTGEGPERFVRFSSGLVDESAPAVPWLFERYLRNPEEMAGRYQGIPGSGYDLPGKRGRSGGARTSLWPRGRLAEQRCHLPRSGKAISSIGASSGQFRDCSGGIEGLPDGDRGVEQGNSPRQPERSVEGLDDSTHLRGQRTGRGVGDGEVLHANESR
jgi:hypothetical protein